MNKDGVQYVKTKFSNNSFINNNKNISYIFQRILIIYKSLYYNYIIINLIFIILIFIKLYNKLFNIRNQLNKYLI